MTPVVQRLFQRKPAFLLTGALFGQKIPDAKCYLYTAAPMHYHIPPQHPH